MADFTPYLSCTRASTGYAQTVAGVLVPFAANVLRITDRGLLIEEARTNQVFRSQELDNAFWTVNALTVTANAAAAPDGTTTAELLTVTSTTDYHRLYHFSLPSNFGTETVTYSAYVKAGAGSWVKLYGDGKWANFNVSAGTVGNKHASATSSIEAIGGGWFRCSVTYAHAGGGTNFQFYFTDSDDSVADANFMGAGQSVYVWGLQIEAGTYASSYIPTTTAWATRAADAVEIIGDADTILDGAAASAVASMDSILKTTQVSIIAGSGSVPLAKAAATSVKTGTLEKTGLASAVTNASKYGAAWTAAGGRSVTGQGLAVETDAGTTAAPSTSYLGASSSGTEIVDAYIRRLSLWDSRISDSDLQSRTA